MKDYVVFVNYGSYEGWKIWSQTDTLAEAIERREAAMGNGGEVVIFKPVRLLTSPREWWICQTPGYDGDAYDQDPHTWGSDPKEPRKKFHVIEYSAYESAIKERDLAINNYESACDCLAEARKERDSWIATVNNSRDEFTRALKERDEARAELVKVAEGAIEAINLKLYREHQIVYMNSRVEQLEKGLRRNNEAYHSERARSAKLVEALKLIIAPGMDPAGVAYGAMEIAREALAEYGPQDSTTEDKNGGV